MWMRRMLDEVVHADSVVEREEGGGRATGEGTAKIDEEAKLECSTNFETKGKVEEDSGYDSMIEEAVRWVIEDRDNDLICFR